MKVQEKVKIPVHHRIHRHLRKHKKHYFRFSIFFFFLVIYGVFEDLVAIGLLHGDITTTTILVSFVIAFIFTLVAEFAEKYGKNVRLKI